MEPQVFLSPLQGFLMIGTLNTFIILLLSCFWIGMLIPSLLSQSHILCSHSGCVCMSLGKSQALPLFGRLVVFTSQVPWPAEIP